MAAGEFLPPVVTRLTGDIGDLAAKVAEAKGLIDSLDGKNIVVNVSVRGISGSVNGAIAQIDRLKAALNDLQSKTIIVNAVGGGPDQGGGGGGAIGIGGGFNIFGLGLLGWLKVVHYGLMILGSQIISDTFGIVAFGLAAVHTLGPVFSAVNNLGAAWNTFSGAQKVAATHLAAFMASMKGSDLQVVTVFDQALQMISSHMSQTGGIVQQAANAFLYFERQLAALGNSKLFQNFLGSHQSTIQTDLQALFTLITRLASALISLAHNFNFLGLWALSGIGMVLKAITWLNTVNPGLARLAFLTLAAYHAFQLLAKSRLGQWVATSLVPWVKTSISAYRGARLLGMGFTDSAMAAVGLSSAMAGVIGASVGIGAVLVAIYYGNRNALDSINGVINGLRQQDQAMGPNIQGYQKLAQTLTAYSHNLSLAGQTNKTVAQDTRFAGDAVTAIRARFQQAAQSANDMVQNMQYLEQKFGLTQTQAYQLAQKLGLLGNMSKRLFTSNDKANIAAYVNTLRQANNPMSALSFDMNQAANATLGLNSQLQGLQNAFNVLAQPFANTVQSTVQWKNDNLALAKAVHAASGQVGYNTAAQKAAAQALATSISDTISLSNNTLTSTKSFAKAKGVIEQEIAVLKGLHSNSSLVARAISILEKQIAALKSKSITITANIVSSGAITVPIYTYPGGVTHIRASGNATGTPSARMGWSWVGETGPELIKLRGGEQIKSHRQSQAAVAAASGGGVEEIHIYLDSREIQAAVKRRTYKDNVRNSNRARDGRPRGTLVPRPT